MPPKRVLIVNVRSLLMESVAGLLESDQDGCFDVMSTFVNNLPDLLHEVEELKAGVLIIDRATFFIKAPELIFSLLYVPNIRLIVLDSRTSKMDIYDKYELMISDPGYFMETIKQERPYPYNQNGGGM